MCTLKYTCSMLALAYLFDTKKVNRKDKPTQIGAASKDFNCLPTKQSLSK